MKNNLEMGVMLIIAILLGTVGALYGMSTHQDKSTRIYTKHITVICVSNFIILPNGSQLIDDQGHGVKCL